MAILIIAEKKKAAEAIAEALGSVKLIKKTKLLDIYHIPSRNIYVLPLRGHLLEYRNTDAFKGWDNINPRDIITNSLSIEKVAIKNTWAHIRALKEYAKICNSCIIGTDADIEGCNIGLIDALPFVIQENPNIRFSQMWLSSLQKQEIIKKFNQTITPKFNWAKTGEARAIIDAVIGFSATKEATKTFKPLLNKFDIRFISIGRVQTSLLYLIYLLEDRIKNFVPEPYFTIEASLNHKEGKFKAYHQKNPFQKEDEALVKNIFNKIKDEKFANVLNNKTDLVKNPPPTPLNTSKALVLLTRLLKINANLALRTMNSLYLNKIISYPRTDSDIYKPDFDHLQYLKKFITHSQYWNYTQSLLKNNRIKPTKGKKDAGDHPPITPLESLELTDSRFKNNIQKRVYDVLARHYLALFGPDAIESKTVLKLSIKDEPFISRILALISEGYLAIAPFLKKNYDLLIKITENQIPVEKIFLNEKETKPPTRYTDTSLLKLMEKNHLGTKSTRPTIIQLLQKRNLIYRNKGRYIITELGIFLIESLKGIWLPFLEPNFTKEVEIQLNEIKENRRKLEDVVKNVKAKFLELFDLFISKKNEIIKLINGYEIKNVNLRLRTQFPHTSSMCPICNAYPMKLITTTNKKRFLACSNEKCKSYLSLPQRGKITILNSKCLKCGFNVFKVNYRKNNKPLSYYICPNCWNKSLKENLGTMFCSKCDEYKILNNKCVKK
ncbi:MAG: DNA topoisomerase [Candidatus Hodarchaeota archaeon]